jgi:predicted PurR-regulated permease PerM
LWLLGVGTLIVSVIWHGPEEARYISERAGELLITLVLAMSGTYLLRPLVNAMVRLPGFKAKRNGRMWATAILFIASLGVLWVFFLLGLRPMGDDVRQLWTQFVPSDPSERAQMMANWKVSLQQALQPYAGALPFKIEEIDRTLAEGVMSGARWIGGKLSHSISPGFIVELILVPVLVFYFLTDGPAIRAEARLLFPQEWRARGGRMLSDLDRVLDGYIRGQVIMCIIAWLFVTLMMLLLGVPYAFTLGLVAGVTRAVPVIGPLLGGIPLVAITLFTTRSVQTTVTLLIAFTLMHFLESKVLLPKIVGHEVDLHPVTVIIALLIGMEFFGFLGVFLAVPIAAVLKILLAELHEKRAKAALAQGDTATLRDVRAAEPIAPTTEALEARL